MSKPEGERAKSTAPPTTKAPAKPADAAAAAPPAKDAGGARLSPGRRWAVRGVLVLATILGIVSLLAVWVNRQALNADNWANTSSALLANQHVRDQVTDFVVDQVYANVDVSGEVESALPDQLKPLAGAASSGLRNLATEAVGDLLQQPLVQDAWKETNRQAMRQLIAVVDEQDNGVVKSEQGKVSLNLGPVVVDAANRIGIPPSLTSKIPPDAGTFTVLESDDVAAVQSYAKTLRGLSVVLPVITFLLFLLALWLAKGRRRRTLMTIGFDLILIGLLVLVMRIVGGKQVVSQLATTDSIRPAIDAVWSIGTHMLRDMAQATLITGIPVVFAGWLAGPSHPATSARKALTPWLRDQRAVVYAVVGALIILLVAWGPLAWLQLPLPVLLMIVLVVIGVEVLRKQAIAEFPEARVTDAGEHFGDLAQRARDSAKRGTSKMSDAWTARREHRATTNAATAASLAAASAPTAVLPAAAPAPVAAPAPAPADDTLSRLERLGALHERGLLTDEEFQAQKRALLASGDGA